MKAIWPRSLSGKLLTTSIVAIVLTASLTVCTLIAVLPLSKSMWAQGDLSHAISRLENAIRYSDAGPPVEVILTADKRAMYSILPSDLIYQILDADGHVLLASNGSTSPLVAGPFDSDFRSLEISRNGIPLNVGIGRFQHAGKTYYIQVTSSQRIREIANARDARLMMRIFLTAAVVAMLVFSTVVLLTLRRVLRPLHDVSVAAAQIEPRNLAARLEYADLPTDIHPLIAAFNFALARLEHGYKVQQELLATVAHELKTPLSLIRGQIELEGLTDRATLLKDVDFMSRQVQQLLQLAEVSEFQNYVLEKVNPVVTALEVTDFLARLAEQRRVLVAVIVPLDPVFVQADRGALYILIKNLLENAIRHSPPGSHVAIAFTDGYLSVKDDGNGIPEEDLPKLFSRFWRGAGSQEGAGLGLSICREIALAHGWTIAAVNTSPGAEFSVAFESNDYVLPSVAT
ncbi:sensor histidine kinase [Luteibacter rhizovicinus]|uniref:sensor histidine kinase n=1 Tax=Luteibacter rhizovicinus TaxID=242606 RepID=UPI00140515A6|nr:HAMP domain-containing sensor histidine kinase [Luteibacter rhizovicinus]